MRLILRQNTSQKQESLDVSRIIRVTLFTVRFIGFEFVSKFESSERSAILTAEMYWTRRIQVELFLQFYCYCLNYRVWNETLSLIHHTNPFSQLCINSLALKKIETFFMWCSCLHAREYFRSIFQNSFDSLIMKCFWNFQCIFHPVADRTVLFLSTDTTALVEFADILDFATHVKCMFFLVNDIGFQIS